MEKRHDFSFGRYFHPEKSPQDFIDITGKYHFTKRSISARRSLLVYDSYGSYDDNGKRIPAKRYLKGFRIKKGV